MESSDKNEIRVVQANAFSAAKNVTPTIIYTISLLLIFALLFYFFTKQKNYCLGCKLCKMA